jgi:PAS domain-containing protein
MILLRQVVSVLATPMFVLDEESHVAFFNEAAEAIFGLALEGFAELSADELFDLFARTEKAEEPIAPKDLAVSVALREGRPTHRSFRLRGLDGATRDVSAMALPFVGRDQRLLGALEVLWENRA